MNLRVKPIVNGLFSATVTCEGFLETAVGSTRDEAARKAIARLKRGLEAQIATISALAEGEELEIDGAIDLEERASSRSDFLGNSVWDNLDEKTKMMAVEVGKLALHAALKHAVTASVGGLFL